MDLKLNNLRLNAQKEWPLISAIIAGIMLLIAHGFEKFGKLAPCALCLIEREIYWAILGFGVISFLILKFFKNIKLQAIIYLIIALGFTYSAIVSGFHIGVEQKWWLGLPSCTGGPIDTSTNLLDSLSKPMEMPSCDKIPLALFGISMAGWNFILSIIYAIVSSIFLIDLKPKK